MTLILHFLTSLPLKRTLILAESLTSGPYNRGFLKRRKSVDENAFEAGGGHTWIGLPDSSVILMQLFAECLVATSKDLTASIR